MYETVRYIRKLEDMLLTFARSLPAVIIVPRNSLNNIKIAIIIGNQNAPLQIPRLIYQILYVQSPVRLIESNDDVGVEASNFHADKIIHRHEM